MLNNPILELNLFHYAYALSGAFVLSVLFTLGIRKLALKWGIVDDPAKDPAKKKHAKPIPLMGGVGMILAFNVVLGICYWLAFFRTGRFCISTYGALCWPRFCYA